MSIKNKIASIYFLFILFLVFIAISIHHFFVINITTEIEKKYISEDVKKLDNYIEMEKESLLGLTKDWAAWTDAWLFMQGKNSSFIKNNLTVEAFVNNKVNLIAYFDLNGRLKQGAWYDIKTKKLLPVDSRVWEKYVKRVLDINDLKNPCMAGFGFKDDIPFFSRSMSCLKKRFFRSLSRISHNG